MRLSDFMSIKDINLTIKSTDKASVIKELLETMNHDDRIDDLEALYQDVLEREQLTTTGIGLKIGLPHAKSKHIQTPSVVFGRSTQGIDFDSLDGDKAHLFFLICIPYDGANLHLKVLAMLSRSLLHESFREELMHATSAQEVLNILQRVE